MKFKCKCATKDIVATTQQAKHKAHREIRHGQTDKEHEAAGRAERARILRKLKNVKVSLGIFDQIRVFISIRQSDKKGVHTSQSQNEWSCQTKSPHTLAWTHSLVSKCIWWIWSMPHQITLHPITVTSAANALDAIAAAHSTLVICRHTVWIVPS